MNHAVLVDASLAVKWVIPEPDRDRALKLVALPRSPGARSCRRCTFLAK